MNHVVPSAGVAAVPALGKPIWSVPEVSEHPRVAWPPAPGAVISTDTSKGVAAAVASDTVNATVPGGPARALKIAAAA